MPQPQLEGVGRVQEEELDRIRIWSGEEEVQDRLEFVGVLDAARCLAVRGRRPLQLRRGGEGQRRQPHALQR